MNIQVEIFAWRFILMNIYFWVFWHWIMKYIPINDIQNISKEIHMPQNGIVFNISMWWVAKNINFYFYSFTKVFSHTTWIFKIISIKKILMN
jgi:hypothetical protein